MDFEDLGKSAGSANILPSLVTKSVALLQLPVNTAYANSTLGIGGLIMTNGSRRNTTVESLSIEVPKRRWGPILFDVCYPSIVAVIVINLALYVGYIEGGQLNDLFPPILNFFGRFL